MALFDPEFSSLSSKELAELDRICGEFERERIDGKRPSIEQCVAQFTAQLTKQSNTQFPAARTRLVHELIRIDIEISLEWDEPIERENYVARFPDCAEFVDSVVDEISSRTHDDRDNPFPLDTPRAQNGSLDTPRDFELAGHASADGDSVQSNVNARSRFQILRNLATGGIGCVYVGMDRDLEREVAIKVLKRKFVTAPNVLARFRTEATITSHLEHPNIVPVYAIGVRSDGLPFYAMRLIRGRSLQQAILDVHASHSKSEASPLDFRRHPACRDLLMRFITACRAAAFAHSRGVLHRDIKPSNIMVDDFGETLLVDWGLALRRMPNADPHHVELASHIVGTPGYMSPEQAAGSSDLVDHRSDIYSLGATLVTLLTKQVPRSQLHTSTSHTQTSNTQVALYQGKRVVGKNENDWTQSNRLPTSLQAIIDKSMRHQPTERYSSAEQLAEDLESWLADEPVSVVRDAWTVKVRRWMKDHPALAGAAFAAVACVTVAMIIGMAVLAAQNETLRKANEREQIARRTANENSQRAEANAIEAVKHRERVLSVLDRFLVDIERGLTNVPGGAKVQRNVLVTVLNELDAISNEFGRDDEADLSNAVALLDMASLFARVGLSDVVLNSKSAELGKGTPLEVAERLAADAWNITELVETEDAETEDKLQLLSIRAQILERQADIYSQTGRAELSLERLNQALEVRRTIERDVTEGNAADSIPLTIAHIATIDRIGQYYLQNKQLERAEEIFLDTHARAGDLRDRAPEDLQVLRTVAISCSRLGDLANSNGDLDTAERWLKEDLNLTERIFDADPENALAKRDLTVSLDRLGRTRENRGQLQEAIEAYEQSRQLRAELLEAEPSDLKAIRELFISNYKLGALHMVLQNSEEAKRFYRQADELAQRMATIDKSNTIAKRYQSMCAEAMCDILLAESKADEALPFAVASMQIIQDLVQISPLDANLKQDLYVLRTKIAKVHKKRGDFESSLKELETTLDEANAYVAQSNRSLQSLENVSYVLIRLGDACLGADKNEAAVDYFERMIEHEATIPTEKRQDADARRLLVNAHSMLGQALVNLQKHQEAITKLEVARKLAQSMIDDQMRVEQLKADLAEIDELLVTCREAVKADE